MVSRVGMFESRMEGCRRNRPGQPFNNLPPGVLNTAYVAATLRREILFKDWLAGELRLVRPVGSQGTHDFGAAASRS